MANGIYNPEQDNPMWSGPAPVNGNPYEGMINGGGGGGFDPSNILSFLTGGSGSLPDVADALWAPALATAYKQYRDSGKYMDTAREAATMANPAGDRSFYVNKLMDLYTNPNAIMSDPSYQWRLNQGMANVDRRLGAAGYVGSGKQAVDLTNYAQNYASQEWEKEVQRLANLGGFQFDPANASKMLMTGQNQQIASQNAALSSLFYPLLAKAAANQQAQRPGMGGGGGNINNPAIRNAITQGAGSVMGPASQWIKDQLAKGIRVDPNDPHVDEAIREMTPGSGIYDDEINMGNAQDIMDQITGGGGDIGSWTTGAGDLGGYGDTGGFSLESIIGDWDLG